MSAAEVARDAVALLLGRAPRVGSTLALAGSDAAPAPSPGPGVHAHAEAVVVEQSVPGGPGPDRLSQAAAALVGEVVRLLDEQIAHVAPPQEHARVRAILAAAAARIAPSGPPVS